MVHVLERVQSKEQIHPFLHEFVRGISGMCGSRFFLNDMFMARV